MRSGIKKSKSKNWKGKPPHRCEAEYSDFRFPMTLARQIR
jgi:hypothetical protein